jgi:plastocyanin
MASSWVRRLLAVGLVGSMLVLIPVASDARDSFKFKASCIGGCHWAPSFKKVDKGTKIVWKNVSSVTHDVKSYRGHWMHKKFLLPGAKTHKILRTRGVYFFRCTIHSTLNNGVCSGMCGKIKVKRR